ncbi:MAG TPA: Lsr2 family protein [Streptosporangiaceae bacterium]|nr:Lsr2 family protein [Streptosporangiaceae bacterium]
MAQKVQLLFLDDIDGSEAEGTVRFGLDGTGYEIDLSTEHATALRNTLAAYDKAARRSPRAQPCKRPDRRIRRVGQRLPASHRMSVSERREHATSAHAVSTVLADAGR